MLSEDFELYGCMIDDEFEDDYESNMDDDAYDEYLYDQYVDRKLEEEYLKNIEENY